MRRFLSLITVVAYLFFGQIGLANSTALYHQYSVDPIPKNNQIYYIGSYQDPVTKKAVKFRTTDTQFLLPSHQLISIKAYKKNGQALPQSVAAKVISNPEGIAASNEFQTTSGSKSLAQPEPTPSSSYLDEYEEELNNREEDAVLEADEPSNQESMPSAAKKSTLGNGLIFIDIFTGIGHEKISFKGGTSDFSSSGLFQPGFFGLSYFDDKEQPQIFASFSVNGHKTNIDGASSQEREVVIESEKKQQTMTHLNLALAIEGEAKTIKTDSGSHYFMGGAGLSNHRAPGIDIDNAAQATTRLVSEKFSTFDILASHFFRSTTNQHQVLTSASFSPLLFGSKLTHYYDFEIRSAYSIPIVSVFSVNLGVFFSHAQFERNLNCGNVTNCEQTAKVSTTAVGGLLGLSAQF